MTVLLQEPDNARARPTSLLKKDPDYNRIFNTSIPIEMYYKCTKIALLATEFLKKMRKPSLHPKDINNIRFHLVMYASATIANKLAPTPNDILKIEISKLDTTFLRKCLVPVFETYASLGGDDQAAKGPEFVQLLKEKLRSVIDQ
ncbi:unnamed protein product [marine sediment metagenome]|uniref:Uncharacterized protein n=1 Tax=marine sediment metagenome TaxID=412755 RepID=X1MQ26_9ZZZZ